MGVFSLKCLFFLVIINLTFENIKAAPFLYNSGKAIISSFFSPEAKNEESGHVEDLRLSKNEKQEMRRLSRDEFELRQKSENQEILNNEASPGIVHKKIGKILAKLQLYTALRSTFNNRNKDESSLDISDLESNESSPKSQNISTGNEKENLMDVLQLDENITSSSTEIDPTIASTTENENKLSLGQNSVAVFFTELIASVATLIYGAALQINNSVPTTTAAPN